MSHKAADTSSGSENVNSSRWTSTGTISRLNDSVERYKYHTERVVATAYENAYVPATPRP